LPGRAQLPRHELGDDTERDRQTLTQFANIKKVVIVYKDGSCFDDLISCGS
jgi:hypothetical protein